MATSPNYSWPEPDNTDLVKNGALAMRTLGNAIDTTMATMTPKSTVTAKGSLIAATAASTPANLAVGNNGETLVADSSTSTGLRYTAGTVQGNPVLNSAYQIWQRGTSFSAAAYSAQTYLADRWWALAGGTSSHTVSRQATGDTTNLPNIQYCTRIQRVAGNTQTTNINWAQDFETINSIPYAGKTITFSFYARAGANYSGTSLSYQVRSGTGTDQSMASGYTGSSSFISSSAALTTTWQRFTATATVSSLATQLGVIFFNTPSGTAGAADYWEVTGVQIDIGSTALPFRTYAGSIQQELAACQRYYEKSYDLATVPGTGADAGSFGFCVGTNSTASNYFTYAPVFKVAKRSTPTITLYDLSGNSGKVNKVSATDLSMTANQTATADRIGETEFRIYSALNAAGGFYGHYIASAEL